MAIDFNVLNQQGALPDFVSRLQQPAQQQESSGGMSASQAAQLNMAYAQDQRQAKLDEVKLAREKQAMGIDANANTREDIKTMSQVGADSAQIERLGSQTKIDWEKLARDTDIAYKDFGLRKEDQTFKHGMAKESFEFDKKIANTRLGKEIEWGDRTADREDSKFNLDVTKWEHQVKQQQDFKDKLTAAANGTTEEYRKVLLAEGRPDLAEHVVNMEKTYGEMEQKFQTPDQRQAYNALATTIIPKLLSGQDLSFAESYNLTKGIYGANAANALTETNYKSAGKAAGLLAFGPAVAQLADTKKGMQAVGAEFGHNGPPDLTGGQVDERSKQLADNAIRYSQLEKLDGILNRMVELAEDYPSIGAGTYEGQSLGLDIGSGLQQFGNKIGLSTGDRLIKEDEANEEFQALATQAGTIYSTTLSGGNEKVNARQIKYVTDSFNAGSQAIESVKATNQAEKMQTKVIGVLADAFPKLSYDQLQRRAQGLSERLRNIDAQVFQRTGQHMTPDQQTEFLQAEAK